MTGWPLRPGVVLYPGHGLTMQQRRTWHRRERRRRRAARRPSPV